MTKIVKKSATTTTFAGINFIKKFFNEFGIGQLIDNHLGKREKNAKFSYSDIIRTYWSIFFCGGEYAEDVQNHLYQTLHQIPNNPTPSADTLLRGLKELAVDNTVVVSDTCQKYNFNINEKLNDLNIKMLLQTKQLKSGNFYDFDYDNQIIEHEKWDAKKTYKHNTGYMPGIASIDNKLIWIENRDGNAGVKLDQSKTLQRVFENLEEKGIFVNRSRMDAGSYSKDIIDVVAKYSKLFYIRANKCADFFERVTMIDEWQKVEINNKEIELSSIPFTNFFAQRKYRLVIQREKVDSKQLDAFTGQKYIYRAILTNDIENTELEVIKYYNQRGAVEKQFDIQNNDFGWKYLPFSDLHHNTVYLIIMAMAKNFYNLVIQRVSKVFKNIDPTTRMRRFIFCFINVAGKWVRRSRQWLLVLYSDRPYELM